MKYVSAFLLLLLSTASLAQINQKDAAGKKQGVWKKPYEGSTVFKYVGQFKNDKPYGKFVYYYETGAVQAVVLHRTDGKTSDAKMYHESGYLMARGKYVTEKKDSIWLFYDDRGIISAQENYKDGLLNGQRVVYYEPRDSQYYVQEYSYWLNGQPHGEYKKYHPNTQVSEEGKYVNGKREGKVFHYLPDGKTGRVEQFKAGVKHGYFITYDDAGKQLGYKLYWDGVLLEGEALKKKEAELRANR